MAWRMKYIRYDDDHIVIFPEIITHQEMANKLGVNSLVSDRLNSAGFVTSDLQAYGRSVGLNIASQPEADTRLIRKWFGVEETK